VIALADHDEPCVLRAAIDPAETERARASIPALQHDRAFAGP